MHVPEKHIVLCLAAWCYMASEETGYSIGFKLGEAMDRERPGQYTQLFFAPSNDPACQTRGGRTIHLSDLADCAQAVSRCVAEQGRVVRLPLHILDGVKRIREVRASLAKERGGGPVSDEEVARVLGIPASKVAFYERVRASPLRQKSMRTSRRRACVRDGWAGRNVSERLRLSWS